MFVSRSLFCFVAAGFALLSAAPFTSAAGKRPNIVFIFSDDHALKAISAYGGALNKTPRIDSIAEDGMLFTRSYCTNSICGPSRASILSGMHSHRNGYLRNAGQPPFDTAQTTLPKLMRAAGYQTALMGKWHLDSTPTGFDHFEILPGQGHYYNPDFIRMGGGMHRRQGYCTDIVTDLALEWLDEGRDKEKPFMIMIQHKAPHRTFAPPLKHLATYKEGSFPEPETLFDDYSGRPEALRKNEMEIGRHFRWEYDLKVRGDFNPDNSPASPCPEYARMTPEQRAAWDAHYEPLNEKLKADVASGKLTGRDLVRWKYQRYLANFMGTVASVDDNVGRVLDYLEENHLTENTIVIYSSDQGFYLGEHGWYDKRWMYEESFAMPFLIRWPGVIAPGVKSDKLIQNIDYAPTLLEIAGAEIPSRMQGRSLVPLLKGRSVEWRDALYYAYYEFGEHAVPAHNGVATDRYKLIHFPGTGEWSLMDRVKDPHELRSFHAAPSHAGVMKEMMKRYEELRAEYDAGESTVPVPGGAPWQARHRELVQHVRKQAAETGLVFIGDESVVGLGKQFAETVTMNLGHPGERTEHALWRLKAGAWPEALQPQTAVVGIGAANVKAGRPAVETANAIRLIVEDIRDRAPGTKVIVLALPESGDARTRKLHADINRRVSTLAGRDGVSFLKDPARLPSGL